MIDKGSGTVPIGTVPDFSWVLMMRIVPRRVPVLWSPSPKSLIMDSPCFRGGLSFRTVPRNKKPSEAKADC